MPTYKAGSFKDVTSILNNIAKEISQQIEDEAIQIAKDAIQETVYERPLSEYYKRTNELTETPYTHRWKNAYGQGFSLAYDTQLLTLSEGHGRFLPQHMSIKKKDGTNEDEADRDVRDKIMQWLDEGFHILDTGKEYKAAEFTKLTKQRIEQKINEIIDLYNS